MVETSRYLLDINYQHKSLHIGSGQRTLILPESGLKLVCEGEECFGAIESFEVDKDRASFEGRFAPGHAGSSPVHFRASVKASSDIDSLAVWKVTLNSEAENRLGMRLEIDFRVLDCDGTRWMIPGCFYRENRVKGCQRAFPRFSCEPEDDPYSSSYWAFRADRASTPFVMVFWGNSAAAVGTDERFVSTELLPPQDFEKGIAGLAFAKGDQALLGLRFPFVEEPISYAPIRGNPAPARAEVFNLPANGNVTVSFYTYLASDGLHSYDRLVRWYYWRGTSPKPVKEASSCKKAVVAPVQSLNLDLRLGDSQLNPWMSTAEAAALLAHGLIRWFYDEEKAVLYETCTFDRYYAKKPEHVDRPDMHVSWISGIPYAFILLKYADQVGDKGMRRAALRVIDNAVSTLTPAGTFWGEWTTSAGWTTGWNPNTDWVQVRTLGEATYFLLQAIEYLGARGEQIDKWVEAVKSNLEVVVSRQRYDGALGQYYHKDDGRVMEWEGCGGLSFIAPFCLAARVFGEERYLDAAKAAGLYYSEAVRDEFIYGAPEDVHLAPTSEDGYNAVMAYMALYESANESKWLDLAKLAADWTLTFRWTYNVSFPKYTILRKYDFCTKGGDVASAMNVHLHNYGLICHGEMIKLWQYTGDDYYLLRERDHLFCFLQFVARMDGDFNARKGMMSEQWFHTDWTHPKGSMLQLAHCWPAGWVIYAHLVNQEMGSVFVDTDRLATAALDAVKAEISPAESGAKLSITNPWDREIAVTLTLHGEEKSLMELGDLDGGAAHRFLRNTITEQKPGGGMWARYRIVLPAHARFCAVLRDRMAER